MSLYSVLTHRQSKPVASGNPVHCVLQTESTSTHRKVSAMPRQHGDGDSQIPTAASKWTKETLDLLNAKYDSESITDFKFDELVIPDDLKMSTTRSINSTKYSHRAGSR